MRLQMPSSLGGLCVPCFGGLGQFRAAICGFSPGNCWLQPVTDRGYQGQRARGWRHLVGGARRVLGRRPPPTAGGFCCEAGGSAPGSPHPHPPTRGPRHPPAPPWGLSSLRAHRPWSFREPPGQRQPQDTSRDSAAVLGLGSGRGSGRRRCSRAAAPAHAPVPPCARPSLWGCHRGRSV